MVDQHNFQGVFEGNQVKRYHVVIGGQHTKPRLYRSFAWTSFTLPCVLDSTVVTIGMRTFRLCI